MNLFVWILSGSGLIFLDLFTKFLAQKHLGNSIVLIPEILELSLSYNTGVAFSIPIPNAVMTILIPLLLGFFVWYMVKNRVLSHRVAKIGLLLIVAGGLGNFINRLWTGSVIDFISFSFWPSFNLADSFLTVGAFLLILFYGKMDIIK